uniref:CLU central domain-containing protein n=1 Tax=Amphimedon queenslandica TaxID=400682 RepID=A0A1X7SEX7_AMPQE
HENVSVRDCIYLNISPIDGTSLKSLLHSRGINNRYIGKIAMLAKSREDLDHLHVSQIIPNMQWYIECEKKDQVAHSSEE